MPRTLCAVMLILPPVPEKALATMSLLLLGVATIKPSGRFRVMLPPSPALAAAPASAVRRPPALSNRTSGLLITMLPPVLLTVLALISPRSRTTMLRLPLGVSLITTLPAGPAPSARLKSSLLMRFGVRSLARPGVVFSRIVRLPDTSSISPIFSVNEPPEPSCAGSTFGPSSEPAPTLPPLKMKSS